MAKSGKAILFVHGILGAPEFFDFLLPGVPADRHIHKILLEGHGATARDFGRASMRHWRWQVDQAVTDLTSEYETVLIVAHSMGTLFAIRQAPRVQGLLLLNPPLHLRLTRRLLSTPFKVLAGKIDDPLTAAAREACSIELDRNPLHYLGWIPRYLELFREIARTRPLAKNIEVPAHVFLSAHDEMVSPRSAACFAPGHRVHTLEHSGHYFYTPQDRAAIAAALTGLLRI